MQRLKELNHPKFRQVSDTLEVKDSMWAQQGMKTSPYCLFHRTHTSSTEQWFYLLVSELNSEAAIRSLRKTSQKKK